MTPLAVSNSPLGDPPGFRKQLRDDGHQFLRVIPPKGDVLDLRRQVLEIPSEAGWLRRDAETGSGDS